MWEKPKNHLTQLFVLSSSHFSFSNSVHVFVSKNCTFQRSCHREYYIFLLFVTQCLFGMTRKDKHRCIAYLGTIFERCFPLLFWASFMGSQPGYVMTGELERQTPRRGASLHAKQCSALWNYLSSLHNAVFQKHWETWTEFQKFPKMLEIWFPDSLNLSKR